MTCAEFFDRYSDYRDGLIATQRELRRFARHLARCAACRKYDAAVQRGVVALREAKTIQPSAEFRRRLEARLREVWRAEPELPAHAGIAAALFVAVALALLALEGVHRPEVAQAPELPPVAFPKPVAQAGLPFVSFQDPRASVVAGNPNPYGTAFVEPVAAGR